MNFIKYFIDNIKYIYQNGSESQQILLTIVLLFAGLSLFVIHPIWLYLLLSEGS